LIHALFTLAITFACAQDTTRPPEFSPEILRQADSIAAAEFARDSLGSITVGIVSGPNLVWSKSYGYADSARTRLATPATVYRIASVTKQFTTLMLLQLVERGRVRLSDPVELYFPEIQQVRGKTEHSPPVTLLQLATMTSGLARNADDGRASQSGSPGSWTEILTTALSKTQYARAPGTGYGYSNIGFAVLAAALARAAGEDYVSYQQRHILSPLGLSSTAFELTPALSERLATGVDFDVLVPGNLNYADAAGDHRGLGVGLATGGLYSTVGDLAKFVSLQLGFGPAEVLRKETLALRDRVPVAAYPGLDYGYGLGYQAYRWGDTVAIGHSGNLAGYTSQILYDPQRKYGVIVLRSAGGGKADAGRLAVLVYRRIRPRRPS
jgi:CubicO group peptidase (beta-lactamase class C family)